MGQRQAAKFRLVSKQKRHTQVFADASLDHSGWTPAPLARLLDLASRLPFEEAAWVATQFGLELSGSDPKSPSLEWLVWEPEAIEALRYLEKRFDSMDYPSFRARGFPIDSGQVEGMNK